MLATASPYPQYFDTDGSPLNAGYLYFGAVSQNPETSPITVYWDAAGTQPAAQPIRTLNGYAARNGAPALIFAAADYSLSIKDSRGRLLAYAPDSSQYSLATTIAALRTDLANTADAAKGDALIGVKQPYAGATARTQHAKNLDFISVKDFGAVGDGAADDTAAIQSALDTGRAVYFPAGTYDITAQVSPQANQLIFGEGPSSKIRMLNGSHNGIYGAVSGVTVRDLAFTTKNQTNATAYKAAILAYNTSGWLVENVTVTNMGHWGIALYDTNDSIVRGCRLSGWFGAIQDSSDIVIYRQSSRNLIEGNYCLGLAPCEHGILIQDPYAGSTPTGNRIVGNIVSEHTYAGIIVYVTTAYNTLTLVQGNHVQDILGTALSNNSGQGIYIQSAGGTIVSDNTVTNCCRSTSVFETQVVAAIGIATGNATTYPTGTICEVVVANNRITAQRGPGISVQDSDAPVTVEGNTILSTGTTAVRGEAIYCANADGVQIKGNSISHANTNYQAININASGKTIDGVTLAENTIRGAAYGIAFNVTGTGAFTNVKLDHNTIKGVSTAGLSMTKITGAIVTGNNVSCTLVALTVNDCPRSKFATNRFYSPSGASSIIFGGSAAGNAGMVVMEDNDLNGIVQHDIGTGGVIREYGDAVPPTGTRTTGDTMLRLTPTVGQPKQWRYVSGTGYVSEGNL